ncbi:MAG: aminotransferase class IV family protein [Anaerolineae bacterium]|nr:aminotransferase class IV family protein [Anaerolineae bacterium]
MPALVKILTPDGLQTVNYHAESLADAARYEPDDGIYTVSSTTDTYYTLKLDAHFDRMEDSARRQGIPLALDRARVRAALVQMIEEANFGSVRFRVTVGRAAPETFILSIEPFAGVPQAIVQSGVRCITAANSARESAEAKTTSWMHNRTQLAQAMPEGIYDTFLLDAEGHILEGLGANFYAILNGELRTAGTRVLGGISRQIVLEVAPAILPVRTEAVYIGDLPHMSEAFLTSSSRGIIPVIEIDGISIGTGQPGEKTRALQKAYNQWAAAHREHL